ncbi:hypothetical protein NX059_001606 [Plenodomus lindquistii]|nr:hypothetical protein NX059_001606 [Plenodomus lindquistii]
MYINNIFLASLAAASTVQAFSFNANDFPEETQSTIDNSKRTVTNLVNWAKSVFPNTKRTTCPPVWREISTSLTAQFLSNGQCTDAARAAIRAAFHDCFNGACDGSLVLANECSNTENRGLEQLCSSLSTVQKDKKVGMADLIQFAGAHAIKTCPGGPTIPVKVGRKDSSTAGPLGVLPAGNAAGGDLVKLFASKGFTPIDLAALIGAHTTAKQRNGDPAFAGASLDSTVGTWDNKFYSETKAGKAPSTIPADKNVAQHPLTTLSFSTFAVSKSAWDLAFVNAMVKMSMLGVDAKGLVDCTSALPKGGRKREVRGTNVWDRLRW